MGILLLFGRVDCDERSYLPLVSKPRGHGGLMWAMCRGPPVATPSKPATYSQAPTVVLSFSTMAATLVTWPAGSTLRDGQQCRSNALTGTTMMCAPWSSVVVILFLSTLLLFWFFLFDELNKNGRAVAVFLFQRLSGVACPNRWLQGTPLPRAAV